jgi:hypothetical protein
MSLHDPDEGYSYGGILQDMHTTSIKVSDAVAKNFPQYSKSAEELVMAAVDEEAKKIADEIDQEIVNELLTQMYIPKGKLNMDLMKGYSKGGLVGPHGYAGGEGTHIIPPKGGWPPGYVQGYEGKLTKAQAIALVGHSGPLFTSDQQKEIEKYINESGFVFSSHPPQESVYEGMKKAMKNGKVKVQWSTKEYQKAIDSFEQPIDEKAYENAMGIKPVPAVSEQVVTKDIHQWNWKEMDIDVTKDFYAKTYSFRIMSKFSPDEVWIGQPIQMEKTTDTDVGMGVHPHPTMTLRFDHAQTLMDAMWHAGIRPTKTLGDAGTLEATQNHLNDMRKIAFDILELKK